MTRRRDLVWVTRAEPGASATARRLRALGWRPLVEPLLQIRLVAAPIDLGGAAALAFTSANGVRAFAQASAERGLETYCVGEATAAAARSNGFSNVRSARGDVAALAAMIAADPPAGLVLHATAARPAGDLVGELVRKGVNARAVMFYETIAGPPPEAALAALADLAGVLLHSPLAGERLGEVLAGRAAPELAVYCLSAEVARAAAGLPLGPRFTAPMPTEEALLSLLPERRKPPRKAT